MNCTAAVIPGMIERQAPGRIITIISDAGRWGDAGLEPYAAAKAGAAGFMRSVARSLGRYEITANSRGHRPDRHAGGGAHPAAAIPSG